MTAGGPSIRGGSGASVTVVVILIAIITVIGVVFTSLFSTRLEESTGKVLSARALYIAEAGVEAAVGHLKRTPVATNWLWRDGYLAKSVGAGTVDVEVLEYESRDSTLGLPYACEPFESTVVAAGANPSRTVYVTLAWSAAADLGLELYDAAVADCANPLASANLLASSATAYKPEVVRYRITDAAPATVTYTARVTGVAGTAYRLRIVHPEESGFGPGNTCGQPAGAPFDECMRGLIALGKRGEARREVVVGLDR